MLQEFLPGDFLIFQLEAGYGLMRVLYIDETGGETVWHVAAYRDFYPDVDLAEASTMEPSNLHVELAHTALTNRAFESTQVSRLRNTPLTPAELQPYEMWKASEAKDISDRSIRLLLGLR